MTAKTTASKKARGRNLQKEVVRIILEAFPELDESDVRSTSMGKSGEDVQLSSSAQSRFNFATECKNVEKLNIWEAIKQSEDPKRKGIPLLVFKRNRSDIYACLKFETLVKLVKEIHDLH